MHLVQLHILGPYLRLQTSDCVPLLFINLPQLDRQRGNLLNVSLLRLLTSIAGHSSPIQLLNARQLGKQEVPVVGQLADRTRRPHRTLELHFGQLAQVLYLGNRIEGLKVVVSQQKLLKQLQRRQ